MRKLGKQASVIPRTFDLNWPVCPLRGMTGRKLNFLKYRSRRRFLCVLGSWNLRRMQIDKSRVATNAILLKMPLANSLHAIAIG